MMMMLGRTRRVRLLAVAVCIVTVYFLYYHNDVRVGKYADYLSPEAVGGGSVLRQPDHAELKTEDKPPAPGRANVVASEAEEAVGPLEEKAHRHKASGQTTATTTTTPEALPATTPKKVVRSKATTSTSISTAAADVEPISAPPSLATSPPTRTHDEFANPVEDQQLHQDPEQVVDDVAFSYTSSYSLEIIHWSKLPEKFPVTSTRQLPTGSPRPIPLIQNKGQNTADVARLAVIKEACKHAWQGYRSKGWGYDEVMPVTGAGKDSFNGWGATLVDSLDTLWIMGMKEEFEDAVNQTAHIDFTTSPRNDIPMFEVTIRYLGGMIAAYDVSGRKYTMLLDKAVELAEILYSAFDTENRMPETYYYWKPAFASNVHRASTRVVLAELGTLSLEFTRLAQLTKESKYYDAIARITDAFEEWQNNTRIPGMWPTSVDASGCAKPAELSSTHTHQQIPVPGGDTYMLTSEPVQQGDAALVQINPSDTSFDATDSKLNNSADGADPVRLEKRQLDAGKPIDEQVRTNPVDSRLSTKQVDTPKSTQTVDTRLITTPSGAGTPLDERFNNPPIESDIPEEPECIPQGLQSSSKNGHETFTLGGQSDSMYEYLPKQYLLLGGRLDQYKDMYLKSMEPVIDRMLFRPMTPNHLDILVSGQITMQMNYTTEEFYETRRAKGEHLTCFAGGMFAMGGKIFNMPEHIDIGRKLTDGCVWAYNATTSGIMPESFTASLCEDARSCEWNETLYWEHLDPYRTYRDEQRLQYVKDYGQEALDRDWSSLDVAETLPTTNHEAETVPPHPLPQHPVNERESRTIEHVEVERTEEYSMTRRRRQLDADSDDRAPALPQPLSTPTPALLPEYPNTNDNEDNIFPPGYDTAADTDYSQEPQAPARPFYTPPPPPTHEEYVKQKIEEERLPPGFVSFDSKQYILRPEAIESVFYMYRITGEQYWRDVGWKMFQAIDTATKAEFGHSALDDVTKVHPEHQDGMESFWIAETLKYFYLLFDDPSTWSLDDWVLNTEAHFFRRPDNSIQ